VIEPRNPYECGADVVLCAEGHTECPVVARGTRSAGVEEQGMYSKDSPGTWEVSSLHTKLSGRAPREQKPRPRSVASTLCGSEQETQCGTAERRQRAGVGDEKSEPLNST